MNQHSNINDKMCHLVRMDCYKVVRLVYDFNDKQLSSHVHHRIRKNIEIGVEKSIQNTLRDRISYVIEDESKKNT